MFITLFGLIVFYKTLQYNYDFVLTNIIILATYNYNTLQLYTYNYVS